MASAYRLALPDEKVLAAQLEQTRNVLAARRLLRIATEAGAGPKKKSARTRKTARKASR